MSSAGTTPANVAAEANAAGRRRSSQSGVAFAGLMNQKRGSVDAATQARRQSFHDAKPATGFLGQMWHNFTTGGPTAGTK